MKYKLPAKHRPKYHRRFVRCMRTVCKHYKARTTVEAQYVPNQTMRLDPARNDDNDVRNYQ